MKQNISGPVGIGIVVVVVIAICVGLYFKFMHEPTREAKDFYKPAAPGQGMEGTMERLRKAGIGNASGAPNMAAPTNTPATGESAGAGK